MPYYPSGFDTTANYTVTGAWIFNNAATQLGSASQLQWSTDLILTRSAAAKLQFGAANAASPVAQVLQAQGSRSGTDTNVAGANLTIAAGQGTGNSTGSSLIFQTPAAVASGTGAQTMTTRLTLDSSGVTAANNVTTAGSFVIQSDSSVYGASSVRFNSDTFIIRSAAAVIQHGTTNSATPVAQTLQAQGSRSGTDSDIGGANFSIQPGTGTGVGTLSTLDLLAPIAVTSGTGAQTQTRGLRIKAGVAVLTNYIVANLPAAATAGAGAFAFVTDATQTAILGLGLAVVGGGGNKVPVYSDGTNWIII